MSRSAFSLAVSQLQLATNIGLSGGGTVNGNCHDGFLKNLHPNVRRSFLAAHQIHIEICKNEKSWNEYQDEENQQQTNHNKRPYDYVDQPLLVSPFTSIIGNEPTTDNDNNNTNKRKRLNVNGSDRLDDMVQNQCDIALTKEDPLENPNDNDINFNNTISKVFRTGNISLYHKFITHFQNFYNEHDILSLITLLYYPCYIPLTEKRFKLWNTCFSNKHKIPIIEETIKPIADSVQSIPPSTLSKCKPFVVLNISKIQSFDSMEFSFQHMFTKLMPDSFMFYYQELMKIKLHPITGDTIVYAPFRWFGTIPSIKIEDNIIHNVSVEIVGCIVLTYNGQNGLITTSEDNYYHFNISDCRVDTADVLKYLTGALTA